MRYFFILFAFLISGCTCLNIFSKKNLTGCDHYSGWCDQIRSLSVHSWEYAQLSQNVYKNNFEYDISNLYEKIEEFENEDLDFFAILYKNKKSNQFVFVYRGTDSLEDFKTGNNPFRQKQNLYALEIFDITKNNYSINNFIVAGHSLGGAIAIHVSLNRENVSAYSFNGSPVFKKKSNEVSNKRYSIVEYGEILKLTRIFGREATQLYTSIGCTDGNPVVQHTMRILATCLTQIAATESIEAQFSLNRNNIEREYWP